MAERYLITGVQLGLLVVERKKEERSKLSEHIVDYQFVGRSDTKVEEDAKRIQSLLIPTIGK